MSFPLTPHKEWSIYDSSKLDDYIACPRKYFYSHILGWRSDFPAHDLYFGQAWHIAREHQLLYGYHDVDGAFTKFLDYYRLKFDESTDSIYSPKCPAGVLNALLKFAQERKSDLLESEVIERDGVKLTEMSGTVPIDEKRVLHYKMDSHMRYLTGIHAGKVYSKDHKTTNGKYINGRQWEEQFYLSIQNGTYTHCLYCMYPVEEVLGVQFEGVGFEYLSRGSSARSAGYHCQIKQVDAFKTREQMAVWLWNTIDLVNDLERDMDRLHHCSTEDLVMKAFHQNPKSCTDYKGCTYHDFCMSWRNPLQRCGAPPIGYHEEFWDPSAVETKVKQDLEFPK
jgi:hypothetical protein